MILVWSTGTIVASLMATTAVAMVGDRVTTREVATVSKQQVEDALAEQRATAPDTTVVDPVVGVDEAPPADSPDTTAAPAAAGSDERSRPSVAADGSGDAGDRGESGGGATPEPVPPGGSGGGGDEHHGDDDGGGPPPAPAPTSVSRTFSSEGGSVGVRCTGSSASLLSASPSSGWTVEVDAAGPSQIDVRFRRADHESRVRASCVAGAPVGSTESH